MSEIAERLKPQLDNRTLAERVEVIRYLFELGTEMPITEHGQDANWEAELESRAADFECDPTTARPLNAVLSELRDRFG